MSLARSSALVVTAALLALGAPLVARANGDPASDVIPVQPVFYGGLLDLESKEAAQLDALVKEARRRGYPINVVVISNLQDMGSADYLYNDPDNYSDYMSGEIASSIKGRLLIVMPGGLGVNYIGHSSDADRKLVDALPPPRTIKNLLPAAIDAVLELAAADGVKLKVPDVQPVPGGVFQPATHLTAGTQTQSKKQGTATWVYVVPVIVIGVLALVPLGLHLRRRSREPEAT